MSCVIKSRRTSALKSIDLWVCVVELNYWIRLLFVIASWSARSFFWNTITTSEWYFRLFHVYSCLFCTFNIFSLTIKRKFRNGLHLNRAKLSLSTIYDERSFEIFKLTSFFVRFSQLFSQYISHFSSIHTALFLFVRHYFSFISFFTENSIYFVLLSRLLILFSQNILLCLQSSTRDAFFYLFIPLSN